MERSGNRERVLVIISRVSPESRLLLACARHGGEGVSSRHIEAALAAGMTWASFLAEARKHGLLPLAQRRLASLEIVPDEIQQTLDDYARRNALRNLGMAHELTRVLELLNKVSIVAVPYKGPTLACEAYGDVSLRAFQDLDVLVRPADFTRAVAALQVAGCRLAQGAEDKFHASFRTEKGSLLELHHDVVRRSRFPTNLELAFMWETLGSVDLLGQPVPGFRPEDTLLLLCLHGAKHEWQGLLWLSDVAAYVRARPELDFAVLLDKADEADLGRVVRLGLLLAEELLDTSLPKDVSEQLGAPPLRRARDLIMARLVREPGLFESGLLAYRLRLELYPGLRHRVRIWSHLLRFVLKPNEQDRHAFPLPSALAAAHYLVRPLRLGYKTLKNRK